ncbi:MAG: phosphate/phosphite/phosphonate ABC transporter substrate-binding protein [Magnetovibrionaceae bacterium]
MTNQALLLTDQALAEPLGIGTITDQPGEEFPVFSPLANHLKAELADVLPDGIKVVMVKDKAAAAAAMAEGRLSIFIDSPATACQVAEQAEGRLALKRWKSGVEKYRSVFFSADPQISTIEDLLGRVVAFEEPFSTSGYLLPLATLRQAGLPVERLSDPHQRPKPGHVGYAFSGDEESSLQWLISGLVSAAALSEGDAPTEEGFTVFGHSDWVPRHVVTYGPSVSSDLEEEISSVLLGLHETEDGKALLAGFENTARFSRLGEDDLATVLRLLKSPQSSKDPDPAQ